MALFLQPPKRPYGLIDMMVWYAILYLKGLIIIGAIFSPLYFFDANIYWIVSVILPISFAGHEWVRGHRKKYGKSYGMRLQLFTLINYPVSVVLIAIISFIYYQHFVDITATQLITTALEIKYTLFALSLIVYFSSFWNGVLFYDAGIFIEKVVDICLIINQWMGNSRIRQLIVIVCVYLVVGIAIYLRWFYQEG